MRFRWQCVGLAVVPAIVVLVSSGVAAQHGERSEASLDVPVLSLTAGSMSPGDWERPDPMPSETHSIRLHRSRIYTAVGGLLLGLGAIHLAAFGRDVCSDSAPDEPRVNRITGGVVAGVGLAFTIGGTAGLLSIPRRQRALITTSREHKQRLRLGMTGAFLLLELGLLGIGMVGLINCASS